MVNVIARGPRSLEHSHAPLARAGGREHRSRIGRVPGWGSAAAGLRQCMRWPMLDCVRTAGCGASRRYAALCWWKHGWASALLLALVLPGCAVGPNYSREPAPVPTAYKELKGWKHATPSDDLPRGDWWTPYRNPRLDTLLRQVEISNQTVAEAAAAYEQSRAIIRELQAALFPAATASYGVTRTRTGALAGTTGGSAVGASLRTRYTTQYSAPISGGWDLDVWGKVRRRSRATRRRRRRVRLISTMPSSRPRPSLPSPISISAPPMHCATCSTAPPPHIGRPIASH